MDPANTIELQPVWNDITPDTLTGVVTVYVDLLDEHGYINQKDPEVPVTFKRSGVTPNECTGRIELKVPDYALILEGKIPMLYGPTGDPLRNVDGVLVAEGFDTHDCDTVFFDVGQWSWGEVFDQVQSTPDPQQIQWVDREINHPGEFHPVGLLFDGEVQFWVVGSEPEPVGFKGDPRRRVSLKSKAGKVDHGLINNWEVFDNDHAAKNAAQQYTHDHWDDLCALRQQVTNS